MWRRARCARVHGVSRRTGGSEESTAPECARTAAETLPAGGYFDLATEYLETVRKQHPDVNKVTYDRLVNHALEGMLSSLDPFSMFIHPEMAISRNRNGSRVL